MPSAATSFAASPLGSTSQANAGSASYAIYPRRAGVTRYLVRTSDVLEDYRITVALETSPATIIWHTERYLSDNEIILHFVHTPTREIVWSVHKPISTRRQGWYIRLRSPQFPRGFTIPLKPVPRASPYYVEEGCLSFQCRTNTIPPPMSLNSLAPGVKHSYSDSSASSSSSSSVHSYPPTPPAMSPIASTRTLRSASEDLLASSHSTVAAPPTIGVPKSRDIVPPSLLVSEPTSNPTESSPSSSIDQLSSLNSTTELLPSNLKPSLSRLETPAVVPGKRRVSPPPSLPLPVQSEVNEFILASLAASTILHPSLQPPPPPPTASTLSSIFSKALNLLKSQASGATSGTSFTLTRLPPAPKSSTDPPPYTSTTSLPSKPDSPTTPTAATYASQPPPPPLPPQCRPHVVQTSISSSILLETPLPPPLLTFTDTTPYLTIYSNQGTLEMNEDELMLVGVEKAFWICVAVVYWGYMGDREGWVWAGED
ncbi:hypothetical protein FA13DRAFT_1802207 [Coprinellus micaceus]|uniref:Uncharacterized protein n=1 Tax=Coprinellus micaceus TaxID=71717 RepID=A0A4Y7SCL0_COPMI|nr:hypothetical protein FA13DRAFT_1802207 [Coprinellus micaceus]